MRLNLKSVLIIVSLILLSIFVFAYGGTDPAVHGHAVGEIGGLDLQNRNFSGDWAFSGTVSAAPPINGANLATKNYVDANSGSANTGDATLMLKVMDAFRNAVDNYYSVQYFVFGIVDEFEDESGVHSSSSNYNYNNTYSYYEPSGGDMTLISESFEAEEEPSEARIIIIAESDSSITYGSDLKAYVSLDNGANYEEVSLSEYGEFEGLERKDFTAPHTSWSSSTGTVSASSNYNSNNYAYNAFADKGSKVWYALGAPPQWVEYDVTGSVVIDGYSMMTYSGQSADSIQEWKFQGYNSAWVDLDYRKIREWGNNEFKNFNFHNDVAYDKYRIYILKNRGGDYAGIHEIELYESTNTPLISGSKTLTDRNDKTMRWKVTTHNGKDIKIHGVALIWQ